MIALFFEPVAGRHPWPLIASPDGTVQSGMLQGDRLVGFMATPAPGGEVQPLDRVTDWPALQGTYPVLSGSEGLYNLSVPVAHATPHYQKGLN